jgi:hypothetical protein
VVRSQPGQIVYEILSCKTLHKNRAAGVTQDKGPKFKPQYQKKKRVKWHYLFCLWHCSELKLNVKNLIIVYLRLLFKSELLLRILQYLPAALIVRNQNIHVLGNLCIIKRKYFLKICLYVWVCCILGRLSVSVI